MSNFVLDNTDPPEVKQDNPDQVALEASLPSNQKYPAADYNNLRQCLLDIRAALKGEEATGSLSLGKIAGISSTGTLAANLCGSTTLTDFQGAKTVTFTTPEPDADYRLSVTCSGFSGSADLDSTRILRVTKSAASFELELFTAPGSGESVTFDWILVR